MIAIDLLNKGDDMSVSNPPANTTYNDFTM